MGSGNYKGGASHYHKVGENIDRVSKDYPFKNGFFGEKVPHKKLSHIYSDDPIATAKDFYDKIGYVGIEEPTPNGKGFKTSLADGTIITWREVSSSDDGSPAVDINIKYSKDSGGLKAHKIHFVKGE